MSTEPLQQAIAVTREVLTHDHPGAALVADTMLVVGRRRALINHVVGAQHFFAARVSQERHRPGRPTSPPVTSSRSFDDGAAALVAAFSADGVMERTLTLPFGEMPGAAFAGLATTDTFQHGWDLAKATGQSTDLAPELAAALLAQSKAAIQDSFRGPEGAPFGPEQAGCRRRSRCRSAGRVPRPLRSDRLDPVS